MTCFYYFLTKTLSNLIPNWWNWCDFFVKLVLLNFWFFGNWFCEIFLWNLIGEIALKKRPTRPTVSILKKQPFAFFIFLQRFSPEWPISSCSKITAVLLLCTDDDNRSYRNVCNTSFVSFALAVIFIIRLFSTSAFRVSKLTFVGKKVMHRSCVQPTWKSKKVWRFYWE